VADVPSGHSLTPPHEIKKKKLQPRLRIHGDTPPLKAGATAKSDQAVAQGDTFQQLLPLFFNLNENYVHRGADKSLAFPIFLFAAQPKEFFLDGLRKLEQRSHKYVELRGEYVE
jgi:hypothetical protein